MKGLSYLALVLSIIALALGIYAFAGGFGGAGTALVGTSTSISSKTATTSSKAVSLTVADSTTRTVSLVSASGAELAKVTIQPMSYTSKSGHTVFAGFNVSAISVTAAGVAAINDAASKVVVTNPGSDPQTMVFLVRAKRDWANFTDFSTKLVAAANEVAKGSGVQVFTTSLAAGRLFTSSATQITASGLTGDGQTFLLSAFEGGTGCDSSSCGGGGTGGQGT